MKVKLDFITNSSSTSFVVIGNVIKLEDLPEKYLKSILEKYDIDVAEMIEEPYEYIDNLFKDSGLQYSFGCEYERDVMVGIPYTSMKDDETLLEFKQRVQLLILEKTGVAVKPYDIEECWRDG